MIKSTLLPTIFMLFVSQSCIAIAGDAKIIKADFRYNGSSWDIAITLKHGDTGWEHYANAWRIMDVSGNEIAKRTLLHPHEYNKAFTRNLTNVKIPKTTKVVYVEAHDTENKWSSNKLKINLYKNVLENVNVIW